ncbi:hypothetical protein FB565_002198 [Actinoplanes lutulentus]|uniref:Uncharacterized protein n=1 Tax=Actinoplanes lutulentus TaxID=1287878 RepID=A0A327ZCE3_9ACTN|nr:hypothetical protein [Actinoplanes lutulentus]MBB2942485.1 hypothetical protein [Actinoplanes lutulentus]RAK38066.1 hypothetical protein B0I29_1056 [Actinoplanes lutulentus]
MIARRDDLFSGRVAPRLARIERELTAAVVDAQSRDWAADRPDRVGFARLGQARDEVRRAVRRYRRFSGFSLFSRRRVADVDDPYFYADLRRRIEACAAAARADRSYKRRAAATDLEYALDWLAAAQEVSHPQAPSRPLFTTSEGEP